MILVLSLFAGRLVQLQGLESGSYRQLAAESRTVSVAIPVARGSITAADGTPLAMTVQTYQVIADPQQIPAGQLARVATALAGPLQMPATTLLQTLEHPPGAQYAPLKSNVSQSAGTQISKLQLPGIQLNPTYARIYPNGDLAANIIGFTQSTPTSSTRPNKITGMAGLEEEYNPLLAGRPGSEEVEVTAGTGQQIPLTDAKVTRPVPARSIRLTINPEIQYYAEQQCALRVRLDKAKNCSIVVIQPSTGAILAMAQYPAFNPAAPASVAATTDIPVANVFAPGSTAKVITVAAALEKGHKTPMSTYRVPDSIVIDGFPFHDAEVHPTARYTIAGILGYSSNVGMVQVAQSISPQVQYDYFRKFGIGSYTGLGLPGESAGLLPRPGTSDYYGDTRYTLAFGQGVAVDAVQMASVYATIANGGVRVTPTLVAGTAGPGGKFRAGPAPARRRVIQAKTAHELMQILEQVPKIDAEGAAPWGEIPGYPVASKTGTAQVSGNGCALCQYGSSYIGIAPADHPKLVVAVNVQHPSGQYYGAQVAGPVFYHVMKFALQTMKIPPDNSKPPKMRLILP
ncbi:MAG: peptidoglycan D,D-transpeptidase FtsI family protein [Streptosporangiaceae bacterium]